MLNLNQLQHLKATYQHLPVQDQIPYITAVQCLLNQVIDSQDFPTTIDYDTLSALAEHHYKLSLTLYQNEPNTLHQGFYANALIHQAHFVAASEWCAASYYKEAITHYQTLTAIEPEHYNEHYARALYDSLSDSYYTCDVAATLANSTTLIQLEKKLLHLGKHSLDAHYLPRLQEHLALLCRTYRNPKLDYIAYPNSMDTDYQRLVAAYKALYDPNTGNYSIPYVEALKDYALFAEEQGQIAQAAELLKQALIRLLNQDPDPTTQKRYNPSLWKTIIMAYQTLCNKYPDIVAPFKPQ